MCRTLSSHPWGQNVAGSGLRGAACCQEKEPARTGGEGWSHCVKVTSVQSFVVNLRMLIVSPVPNKAFIGG